MGGRAHYPIKATGDQEDHQLRRAPHALEKAFPAPCHLPWGGRRVYVVATWVVRSRAGWPRVRQERVPAPGWFRSIRSETARTKPDLSGLAETGEMLQPGAHQIHPGLLAACTSPCQAVRLELSAT